QGTVPGAIGAVNNREAAAASEVLEKVRLRRVGEARLVPVAVVEDEQVDRIEAVPGQILRILGDVDLHPRVLLEDVDERGGGRLPLVRGMVVSREDQRARGFLER